MHGENAKQKGHTGKEYWKSRLHKFGEIIGWYTKKLTHKKERRISKKLEHDILDRYEGFVGCGLRSYDDLHIQIEDLENKI